MVPLVRLRMIHRFGNHLSLQNIESSRGHLGSLFECREQPRIQLGKSLFDPSCDLGAGCLPDSGKCPDERRDQHGGDKPAKTR